MKRPASETCTAPSGRIGLGIISLALLALPSSVGAQEPTRADDLRPAWSPDGRSIAFESMRDGNSEIYVLDLERGDVRRLTDDLADDVQPSWSPDGSRIVFASDRTRNAYSGRATYQLYVMNADGSEPGRLIESGSADFMPRWSPDGRWIAFLSDRDGSTGLYVVPSEGGQARSVLPAGFKADAGNPSWSPDSRRIAFDARSDSVYDVFSVDIESSEVVNHTRSKGPEWWYPAWSPDGRTLLAGAFTGDAYSGAHQIVAVDMASGRRAPLTPERPRNGGEWDFWPSWSPDGSRVVLSSRRDGSWALYVVGPDGSGERRLETRPHPAESPTAGLAARAHATADSALATLEVADAVSVNQLGYTMVGGFGAGDVWAVTEIFRLNTERNPEWANGWDSYGELLARRGDLDAALAAYRRALALDPRLPTARSALVMLTSYRGDAGRALALGDSILAVARAEADTAAMREALSTRSAVFLASGRWEEAAADAVARRALKSPDGDGEVRQLLDHSYWDDHLLRNVWIEAGEVDRADSIQGAAMAHAERAGGSESVLRGIRLDDAFYRASAAVRRGEWERALEIAAPLRIQPSSYGNVVAKALLGMGRAAEAADTLRALTRDGYYGRYLRGRASLAQGDTARARDLLRDVVTWNQLGAWFWLHEYVIRRRDAQALLDSIRAGWDEWAVRPRATPFGTSAPFQRAHPSWSPDGQWIAFDAAPNGNWDIFVVRPDGSGLRRLAEAPGRDVGPRWHPDSNRLFFLSDRRDGRTLESHEVSLSTGEIRAFTFGGDVGAREPWFSPDGRRVAFHRPTADGSTLWWGNADGSGAQPVAEGHPLIGNPVWSSDGRYLAFSEGEASTFRIRVVDEAGETVLTVPHEGTGRDVPRGLDLDAGLVLFHSDRDQSNVFQTYLYDVATGETRQLTVGPRLNGAPSFSPDHRRILFESNRDGIVDLYLMELDEGREVRRVFPPEG